MQIVLTAEQIEPALPRVCAGLEKYTWLQKELPLRDVSRDCEYQKRFGGIYRVRRNTVWRKSFFQTLEQAKSAPLTFDAALQSIYAATGRMEASFASKLIATIDPDQPVIDSVVLRNLKLKPPSAGSANRCDDIERLHMRIGEIYSRYLESRSGRDLVARFRRVYPGTSVTRVKMLDFVLWQSRCGQVDGR